MRISLRPLLLSVLAVAFTAPPARSQAVAPDTAAVPAADGTVLHTLVFRPAGAARHPALLVRTPYDAGAHRWLADALVPAGYAVVLQDVRGTGTSQGQFVPFVNEAADGRATLEWLLAQPWSDGRVALWGISYHGYTAFQIAQIGQPSVGAVVAINTWADLGPFLAPGGAFHLALHLPWFLVYGLRRDMPPAAAWQGIFRTAPLSQLFQGADAIQEFGARPFPYDRIKAPVLHVGGWYDYTNRHTLATYARLADRGLPQRLIVGPWAHNGLLSGWTKMGEEEYGPQARMTVDSVARWTRDWLDAQLKGRVLEGPPVRLFVMGENRWRGFDRWPPSTAVPRSWYLAPAGRLADTPGAAGTESFRYDPNDPMPTLGGANSHFFPETVGPRDQRSLDTRADVLRFLSEPVPDDGLMVVGPLRAVLFLEARAPSTDLTAKLVVVRPDGSARGIADGILRLSRIDGVVEAVIDLAGTAIRLEPGARLRLDVSGGNFPEYDRNPNTGEPSFDATEFQPVLLTVHRGGVRQSRIEAFVVPPSR
jgi:hypothetical protein